MVLATTMVTTPPLLRLLFSIAAARTTLPRWRTTVAGSATPVEAA
jgi:hypothetical protein